MQNALNTYFNNSGKQFVFIRIPKNAGASLGTTLKPFTKKMYGAHFTAKQQRESNPELYDQCISFTFARNPWDRFVSWYMWQTKGSKASAHIQFEEYIEHVLNNTIITTDYHTPKQLHYLVDSQNSLVSPGNGEAYCNMQDYNHFKTYFDNPVIVTHIFKTENLPEDWQKCCKLIGIPYQPLGKEHKSQHRHYTTYYTPKTEELVYEFYKDDIERLGYKFNE